MEIIKRNKILFLFKQFKMLHSAFEMLCLIKEMKDLVKTKRSCCVREINRDRNKSGFFKVTFLKIKQDDMAEFFRYTRMHPDIYNILLNLLTPHMLKTSIRIPISPECRLAVLLFYLSHGTSLQSVALSFKLGRETVRQIVLETSEILWKILSPIYVREPNFADYKTISEDFWNLWNIPNCLGAIDGKHFPLRYPPNSGNQNLKHKKDLSVNLFAVCDAKYCFTHIDLGAYGSQRDGGIFHISSLGKKLLENKMPIPQPKSLPNSTLHVPHYFVGSAAFPLSNNLMRPYSGKNLPPKEKNFNKRIARARRTIENSFGILVARWRILLTTLHLMPENAEKIILACIALHNFIMLNKQNESYCPTNFVDREDSNGQRHEGLWRNEVSNNIQSILPSSNIHQYGGKSSTTIRNNLRDFLTEN